MPLEVNKLVTNKLDYQIMENINNKAETILREYVEFKDINQSETVELLPLTIVDCMEEYAIKKMIDKKTKTTNDAKPLLNDGFIIDFFELMFLAESVIPERPIARSMCFDDFSERHYHNMNENQRKQFFEHVQKQPSFSLENEKCRHFFARFNPKNQYLVSCFHNGKADEIRCYLFNDKFHTSKNRSVNPEYIKTYISEYSE
ncbi:MAG: hypothetical protein ACK5XN_35865 [Bacteroidota bacterium]